MSKTLDFYFSFISPFSYIAYTQLAGLAERTQCNIAYHALDHHKLFKLGRNPGPIYVPAKVKYLGKDLRDWCKYYNIPFKLPSGFPHTSSCPAAGGGAIAQTAGKLAEWIDTVLQAYFVEDLDISDPQVLQQLATQIGLDAKAVASAAADPAILQQVDTETKAAAKRGVFGVPTFFIGDDMYWGNDRLMFVEQALKKDEVF